MTGLLLDTDARRRAARATPRRCATSGERAAAIINDILDFSKIEAGKLDLERAAASTCATASRSCCDLVGRRGRPRRASTWSPTSSPACRPWLMRRRHPAAPGAGQPARQRGQVHRTRRGACVTVAAAQIAGGRTEPDGLRPCASRCATPASASPPTGMDRLFQLVLARSTPRPPGATAAPASAWPSAGAWPRPMGGRPRRRAARPASARTFTVAAAARARAEPERPACGSPPAELAGVACWSSTTTPPTAASSPQPSCESWGMRAARRSRRVEALARCRRRGEPFDVAILDMHMPDMDGITLADGLRRQPPRATSRWCCSPPLGDRVPGTGRARWPRI